MFDQPEHMIATFKFKKPIQVDDPVECVVGNVKHDARVHYITPNGKNCIVAVENMTTDSKGRYLPDLFDSIHMYVFTNNSVAAVKLQSGIGAYFSALIMRSKKKRDPLPRVMFAHKVRYESHDQLSFEDILNSLDTNVSKS